MDNRGGRVTIEVNGRTMSGRGAFKVRPARAVPTNGSNTDGTGYTTVEAKLASLEGSFDRGNRIPWDEAWLLEKINVTFVEKDVGVTHLFTAARWSGEPELDSATGEVSGLRIESDKYQQI